MARGGFFVLLRLLLEEYGEEEVDLAVTLRLATDQRGRYSWTCTVLKGSSGCCGEGWLLADRKVGAIRVYIDFSQLRERLVAE